MRRGETYVRGNGSCEGWKKAFLPHFRLLVLTQLYPPAASSALSVCGPVRNADIPDSADFRNADISDSGHECFSTNSQGQKKMHYFIFVNQFHLFRSSQSLQKENILSRAS